MHEPLVSKELFNQVQDRLDGKTVKRMSKHNFLYRQLLRCAHCNRAMIGERQKGHVYYRCHHRDCHTTTVREEVLEAAIQAELDRIDIDSGFKRALLRKVRQIITERTQEAEAAHETTAASLAQVESQLAKLTTAYIDRELDLDTYELTKKELQTRRTDLLKRQSKRKKPPVLEEVEGELEQALTA